ncbi:RimK family protein [Halobacteriovorax sp. RT-2-6]|uniref:RimK family protein n=1 Tax=unclassified Halobacteriovorax TaxID=2639665 RepID=UPI00399BA780
MEKLVVIVDRLKDWQPYFPTDQVITAKDYLSKEEYQQLKNLRVLNLCNSSKYLSLGYYTSLIAEARGHKVMPTVKTINDLCKKKHYTYDLDELQSLAQEVATKYIDNKEEVRSIAFRVFFGETKEKLFRNIGKVIFNNYPVPIFEVRLAFNKIWKINSIVPVHISDLSETQETFFADHLEKFNNRIWRLPNAKKQYKYDLAILVDDKEKLPPSNPEAIKKFIEIGNKNGLYVETISKYDLARINEFDALFIRTTTSLVNPTYAFAKTAVDEGLIVIDDPNAILKCTNKIYLHNLFKKNGINTIKSEIVSDYNEATLNLLVETLKLPMVLKIPDGSFSIGVTKVETREELKEGLKDFLHKSALILVQEFLYTDFDWRIGVINKKPFYACKYFMSKEHWQIYNHASGEEDSSGDSLCLAIEDVPQYVIDTATKACAKIGDGLFGVDIKDDGKKAYVVEVNDNPNLDFGVEDELIGDELYEIVIKHFIHKIEETKNLH